MSDFPDIPDFLKISEKDRKEAWKNLPLRPSKSEDPATAELRREVEKEKK